jgi:hypothetical protein
MAAKDLRNKRIAHFERAYVLGKPSTTVRWDFEELKSLRDALFVLHDALSFDVEWVKLPLSYELGQSDIDELLDAVARCSPVLNLPEEEPDRCLHVRARTSAEELAHLNAYRMKFGMHPA